LQVIKNNDKQIWPDKWSDYTCVMGVLNITPDSFSDGGNYFSVTSAIERASILVNEGADVIDIGCQSTRPGAQMIGPDVELKRLIPVLRSIRNNYPNLIISIDTFHSKVAEKALKIGANWINDTSCGRYDENILDVVANYNCPYILMHSRGDSQSMDLLNTYNNVTSDVINELLIYTDKAISKGISKSNIIWDPGIGFAKDTHQNLKLLKDLELISEEGFPLLVGPSRKRFIGEVLNEPNVNNRLIGTVAVACRCVQAKVSLIRVHDVKEISQAIVMSSSLYN
tara:strand:- start:689 stop:1537 length:849 start_codon:yes stop_codon:yes gene_type:complete